LRLIDPRKLYSILRPGSINRLIVNNPNWGIVWLKNYDDMLSCFHMIPQRHGRTDRHTDIYGQTDRFAISISRVSMLTPRNGSF